MDCCPQPDLSQTRCRITSAEGPASVTHQARGAGRSTGQKTHTSSALLCGSADTGGVSGPQYDSGSA